MSIVAVIDDEKSWNNRFSIFEESEPYLRETKKITYPHRLKVVDVRAKLHSDFKSGKKRDGEYYTSVFILTNPHPLSRSL